MIKRKKRRSAKIGKRANFALAIFCLVFGFTTIGTSAMAGTEVTATVDRNALNPDDTLTLTLSVDSDENPQVGQPTFPGSDFQILNQWTSTSQQASMVSTPSGPQFKKTYSLKYNYMLQPTRQGSLTIAPIVVAVNGRDLRTKPITIKVAPGAGAAAPQARGRRAAPPGAGGAFPPDLFDDDEDDMFSQLLRRQMQPPQAQGGSRTLPINPQDAFFVQVETDKTEAYAGEQVTVSFFLYTRGMIRDLDTLKYPALKGFWKEDIEIATHLNFQSEVVNGIPYKKALLASFALFPLKEGTATIDPYEAKCSVITPNDVFGGFATGKAYTYTKSSQPVKITVKPLPTEGRPADFSGAVGDFQVTSRVEDRNVIDGQPFTLKLRFEGRGNAKLIDLPPFQPPEGLEFYDQQNEAKFFQTGASYKEFKVLLIPRHEGDFTIPPISVSIFDPQKKAYVKKATEPITIHVGKALPGQTSKDQALLLPEEQKQVEVKTDEPHLLVDSRSVGHVAAPVKQGAWSVLFLALCGGLFLKARNELGWGQRKKDVMRALNARMKRVESRATAGDWRGVGTEMTNTVYFVLGQITGEGGANVELSKLLLKAPPSVRRELAEPLARQMETFQILTFAPDDVVGTLKNPAELSKSISEMRTLMAKAVSLGLSSEQGGGSESGPKAS